jgi:hypothetical protein
LVIKFSVERWWKGSGEEEVFLYTGVSRWPGGYTRIVGEDFKFKVGDEYLVYAFGENENLATTECERTTKLEKADEDLKALGEGRRPEKKKAKVSLVTSPPNVLRISVGRVNRGKYGNGQGAATQFCVGLSRVRRYLEFE